MTDRVLDAGAGPVAIICGGGTFPFTVADSLLRNGRKVVLFALRGWADASEVERFPHHWAHIVQFGRFVRLARKEGCRDVIFIGSLVRPGIRQLISFDWTTVRVLPRAIRYFYGGDDHLLKGVARIFEDHGFRLLGAHEVAPEILIAKGPMGQFNPSDQDMSDIARGLAALRAMGPHDIGQAIVVAQNQIVAVEAAEGTDQMLARVADLRRTSRLRTPVGTGVLVKAPKPNQDRRFDLPSIGPRTIDGVVAAGLAGIAVIEGGTIVAEPQIVIQNADRAKVFVTGLDETP